MHGCVPCDDNCYSRGIGLGSGACDCGAQVRSATHVVVLDASEFCAHQSPPCAGCALADRLRGGTATYCAECSSAVPPGSVHACAPEALAVRRVIAAQVAERQAAMATLEWDALRSWAYRQGMHVAGLRGVDGPLPVNNEDERG